MKTTTSPNKRTSRPLSKAMNSLALLLIASALPSCATRATLELSFSSTDNRQEVSIGTLSPITTALADGLPKGPPAVYRNGTWSMNGAPPETSPFFPEGGVEAEAVIMQAKRGMMIEPQDQISVDMLADVSR